MNALTLQGPTVVSELSKVGKRRWRKQILPLGSIDYAGRKLEFTREYFEDIVKSFRDSAYDTVPFVLADESNRHTMAPERAHGEVVGLSVEDDGLYADVEMNETAQRLVSDIPKLGVSVRVLENLKRPDGKFFKAALQHVLATFDPKVNGMKPWVALSHQVMVAEGIYLDYSTTVVEPIPVSKGDDMTGKQPEGTAPFLTKEQLDKLEELNDEDLQAIASMLDGVGGEDEGPDGDQDGDDGDESGEEEEEGAGEPTLVAASNAQGDAVELANAQLQQQAIELAQMRAELDAKNFDAEKAELVRSGIPPVVVDLAKPLLLGSGHVVELSNASGGSEKVDAGKVLRDVLKEYANQAKLVDLSEPVGFATDTTGGSEGEEAAKAKERDDFIARHRKMYRL